MSAHRIRAPAVIFAAAALVATSAPLHAADTAKMMLVNPQTVKFETVPVLPSCVTVKALRGNPRFGPAWVLLKLASGCRVPWHWHTPNEDLVVISGQGNFEMKDSKPLPFVPGAYASLPSHHVHRANCVRSCLLFDSADAAFDIHYVDANDQEISMEEAMKQAAPPPPPKRPAKPVKKKVKK